MKTNLKTKDTLATTPSRRKTPARSTLEAKLIPHFDVNLDLDSEANFYTGLEGTIRSGGLFIATYDTQEPGAAVKVSLRLPSGRITSNKAVVEWVRGYSEENTEFHPGIGVVFDTMSEEDELEINCFIKRRGTIFYEAM